MRCTLHVCSIAFLGLPKEAEERLWDDYQMNKVVLDSVQNDAMPQQLRRHH
jgi:hypothetical protein